MTLAPNYLLGCLPASDMRPILVEDNQDVYDIINLITFAHKRNAESYDKICGAFWAGDTYNTCERLFDFCKKYIDYDIETEKLQTVRSPRRILEMRKGDCKHYAGFIGGVLDGLRRQGYQVQWCYRFASYKLLNDAPSHVFVVAKDSQGEIWIDPVLDNFDDRKEYVSAIDRRVNESTSAKKVSAVGFVSKTIGDTGATVKVIGGAICAVAPAVAVVIPVGTVVAAAAEVVGGIMNIVGGLLDKYKTSTQVRWLTQLYQYYVLGQSNVTSDHNVNENYTLQAQSWFSLALGVPIYDRLRFNALKTSASAYVNLSNAPDTKNVDPTAVAHAVAIAATMDYSDLPGGWANFPPANIVLENQQNTSLINSGAQLAVNSSGQLVQVSTLTDLLPYILIGGALLFLL